MFLNPMLQPHGVSLNKSKFKDIKSGVGERVLVYYDPEANVC